MICTTLGYITNDESYLMLHRVKKEKDISKDKWIGIGGKLENGEGPLECIKRECLEETGLVWKDPQLRSVITFNYRKDEESELLCEQMFLFTGKEFEGNLIDCQEGVLTWVKKSDIPRLNLWIGDLIFFDLLDHQDFFFLRLDYVGDDLRQAYINDQLVHDPQQKIFYPFSISLKNEQKPV